MTQQPRPTLPDPAAGPIRPARGRRGKAALDRIELYYEHGSLPGARRYRWRMKSGANGQKLGSGHDQWSQRDRALGNARYLTGYDLAHKPDFTEPQAGIDGEVSVWLVDPKSRRGFPG